MLVACPSIICMLTGLIPTVLQVLSTAKQLPMWGAEATADKAAEPKTFYDLLVAEKDIVRMILLLTGAIQSAKQGVADFAKSFDQFSLLWMKDLAAEYATFLATNPNLEVLTQLVLLSGNGCLQKQCS